MRRLSEAPEGGSGKWRRSRISAVPAAVTVGLVLVACANQPSDEGRGGGPPPPRLFISPAGKPFRPSPSGPAPLARWIAEADAGKDGVIDRAELVADFSRFFTALDVDKDDWLQGAEITRYEQQIAPEILGGAEGPQGGAAPGPRSRASRAGPAPQGAGRFGLLNDAQPIMSADYDLNRRVAKAEFERKAADVFRRLDLNGDGKLVAEELKLPVSQPGRPGGGGGAPRRGGRGGPPGGGMTGGGGGF